VERRTVKRLRAAGVVLSVIVVAIVAAGLFHAEPTRASKRPDVGATDLERVRVQVLNATNTRGLARRATQHLRDQGFDVLEVGTANEHMDSTLVLDRSGHPEWARRVADALGGARVESRPDSSRYLDVTVLLGRSWRPPTQPFYP
jgi:LytR cell envelope-related transcriptional attenuator